MRDYRGTFLHEAEQDLEELRATFRRKAHGRDGALPHWLLRAEPDRAVESWAGDAGGPAPGGHTEALGRRRAALGLPDSPDALVMVDHDGHGYAPGDVALALRRARSTRISIDGNAHFAAACCAPATRTPAATRPSGPTGRSRPTRRTTPRSFHSPPC